jgi:uncharacterized repeat protein (TIGR01451 family)
MKTKSIWIIWMAVLLTLPAVGRAQFNGHIQLASVAEIEKEVFNEEGRKEIKRMPAAKVVPGHEVIFTTTYKNVSKEKAEKAVITNPVPEHMLYKENSASGMGTRITFSIDHGKSFNIPVKLFVLDAAGRKYPARPQDYTHIRWEISNPLQPGAKGEVSFRAILK